MRWESIGSTVVRMRDVNAARMLCRAFHQYEFYTKVAIDGSRMAIFPAKTGCVEPVVKAICDLCIGGADEAFQTLLNPDNDPADSKTRIDAVPRDAVAQTPNPKPQTLNPESRTLNPAAPVWNQNLNPEP